MDKGLKRFLIAAGILSFLLCLSAGVWILSKVGLSREDAFSTGLGLYFIGKALFVGPMLIATALHYK
jgi:hypothetical protein